MNHVNHNGEGVNRKGTVLTVLSNESARLERRSIDYGSYVVEQHALVHGVAAAFFFSP